MSLPLVALAFWEYYSQPSTVEVEVEEVVPPSFLDRQRASFLVLGSEEGQKLSCLAALEALLVPAASYSSVKVFSAPGEPVVFGRAYAAYESSVWTESFLRAERE